MISAIPENPISLSLIPKVNICREFGNASLKDRRSVYKSGYRNPT
jgi:hypothetical protein